MIAGNVIYGVPAMQGLYIMELPTPNSTPWQIIYVFQTQHQHVVCQRRSVSKEKFAHQLAVVLEEGHEE
jgi:hypothetical protein